MGFLSYIVKALLWPIKQLTFKVLYKVFIYGPLWVLNTGTKVISYATDSKTDPLLFDTPLSDSKPMLNFFHSTDTLHTSFICLFRQTMKNFKIDINTIATNISY